MDATTHNSSVLVAMSGGVDSTVAAALLREAGREVMGVFFDLQLPPADAHASLRHADDARRAAETLGIPLRIEPVGGTFGRIVEDFLAEYARGRTPNPCVLCNARVKFATLLSLAGELGIECVATGHHARRATYRGRPAFLRASGKDQSYALFAVAPCSLGRIDLPLGEMPDKQAVRDHARRLGLAIAEKPDSQDICFLPEGDYAGLLARRAPQALTPGPIVDTDGAVLGRHDGFGRFTVGQRRGLGVAAGEPLYVIGINPQTATVTAGPREAVLGRSLRASGATWQQPPETERFEALVQIRYHHRAQPAEVRLLGDESFEVRFAEPVAAITPGQAAVVYDGPAVLGGGWIDRP